MRLAFGISFQFCGSARFTTVTDEMDDLETGSFLILPYVVNHTEQIIDLPLR